MASIRMDVKADTSEVREIIEECARLVSERTVPDHLLKEIEALADPATSPEGDMIRMEAEGDGVVAIAAPRLLALVANLRACRWRTK